MRTRFLLFTVLLTLSTMVNAQGYNFFTSGINMNPNPSVAAGFPCGTCTLVEFNAGLTTNDDVPLDSNNPIELEITLTGFAFGPIAIAGPHGAYGSNFTWVVDPNNPLIIKGTQNTTLPGIGTNPLFPNPLAAGLVSIQVCAPSTLANNAPIGAFVDGITPMTATHPLGDLSQGDDDEDVNTNYGCVVLPVELTDFQVAKEGKDVKLEWTTATESNSDYFAIEISTDGLNFQEIGRVDAQGFSTENYSYDYMHDSATKIPTGRLYYRLRPVDVDGSYEFSDIRSIVYKSEIGISLYPNPVITGGKVSVLSENIQFIDVFAMDGRRVEVSTQTISKNEAALDVSGLAKGIYFVRLDNGRTSKFIVQ